jgi:transcriptional regulator with XRE-family HTH domain
MKTYEFSIIASGMDPQADDFESRFYDNGCDDALVSFQKGHIIIDFAREAESVDQAIASAIEDVRSAGAVVDRVEPDPLVSLSEISARVGVSRAAVSLYAKGDRGVSFPAPIAKVTDDRPLWRWATVAQWFFSREQLPKDALIEALVVNEANEAIASGEQHIAERLKQCAEARLAA